MKKILVVLFLIATPAFPQSATLTYTASTSTVVGYNAYRGNASGGPYTKLNTLPFTGATFVDNSVTNGNTFYYVLTAVDQTGTESVNSNEAVAVVPAAPSPFPPGARIALNTGPAPIRSTALVNNYGPQLGTEPAGATGTVTTAAQVDSKMGWIWIPVQYDTCQGSALVTANCTGYTGSDNMHIATAPPTVAIAIAPLTSAITFPGTATFTGTVTGSTNTAVTWSANAPKGVFTSSAAGMFTVTVTSVADPTKSAMAIVTVTAPPATLACPQKSNTATTDVVTCTIGGFSKTQSGTLTWTPNGGSPVSVTVTHP